jgi:predicted GIY-YIG superfamily endonuclease
MVASFLWPAEDDLDLKTVGVYSITCEYGKVYICQTGCSVETRIKEHHQYIRLHHPDKSTVTEHSIIDLGHSIQSQDTMILAMKSACKASGRQ